MPDGYARQFGYTRRPPTAGARTLNRRIVIAGLLGACATTLAGCGQKGPLYLPSEKLEELERKREDDSRRTGSLAPDGTREGIRRS